MNLDKALKENNISKKFKTKKPNWRHLIECIDATRYAPMAGDIFTPRFIIVQDPEKIQKIARTTQQHFVSSCNCMVVMCSEPSKTHTHFGSASKDYIKLQTGAAIQNLLLKLKEKKLATTWIKLFVEKQIKEILKIPHEIEVEAIFPIGYSDKDQVKKRKLTDLDNILFFEKYKNTRMSEPKLSGIDSERPMF